MRYYMKKATIVALLLGSLLSRLEADIIFDNSITDLLVRFDPGTYEVGDEIILAGNARYLTNFSFEYWGTNLISAGDPLFSGDVQCRIRIYKNDGPPFNGYATPGTCVWSSEWVPVMPTPRSLLIYTPGLDFPASGLYVPASDITWTVQFRGMGPTDRVGVDFYSPAGLGSDYPDYWLKREDGWALRTNSVVSDFAARIEASLVPTPAIPSLYLEKKVDQATVYWPGWATNWVLQTSPILGPGASWNPVSGASWEDNNFIVTNDIVSGNAFFRLRAPLPSLIHEDFDSGTMPSGWYELGTPNWGYTPAIAGTYSLGVSNVSGAYFTFEANQDEVYAFFEFEVAAFPSDTEEFFELANPPFDESEVFLLLNTDGTVILGDAGGVTTAAPLTKITANTVWYVWVHYKVGTGTNAFCSVGISTSLSAPTSGDGFASFSNGVSTQPARFLYFQGLNSNAPWVYDHLGADMSYSMSAGW
jgi:hypothetical protein